MIGHDFPYLDTRDLNLDWLIKNMKQILQDWATYQQTMNQSFADLEAANAQFKSDMTTAFNTLHDFVDDYFDNLDVQQEIDNKLDAMKRSGELAQIMDPLIADHTADWLSEHITNPSSPPIDTSLTVRNAAADAQSAGLHINYAKQAFLEYANDIIGTTGYDCTLEQSGLDTDGLNAETTQGTRVRTQFFIPLIHGATYTLSCTIPDKTGQLLIVYYDDDDYTKNQVARYPETGFFNSITQTINNTSYKFARVMMRASDNSAITPADVVLNISINTDTVQAKIAALSSRLTADENTVQEKAYSKDIKNSLDVYANDIIGVPFADLTLEQGGMDSDGINQYQTTRVRSKFFMPLIQGATYTVTCSIPDKTGQVLIALYENADYTEEQLARIPASSYYNRLQFTVSDPDYKFGRFMMRAQDGSDITPEEVTVNVTITTKSILDRINEKTTLGNSYSIQADFTKHNIELKKLGTLTTPSYFQGFIKYDGDYYCIDSAGNLNVVDSDTFEVLSTTQLSFGHGNSFNLGENGTAYISGWNDNTIYVLDLATKTITSTISLPSSITHDSDTRFSAAVDDYNNIAYVLLRWGTNTNFVGVWQFFAFNITDGTVILNKRFPYAFGGIQGMDFYCGRIIVAYGAGTIEYVPERSLLICDTNGNMLTNFKIAELAGHEPEGVFVDRGTEDLLFTIGEDLYKIESVVK